MKVLFYFLLSISSLLSQTYKVDISGLPNQYPTQIEVVDGDVIIATTENLGKGYGIDAVSLINVTKNKVFRVENSSRQANPRILIDSNKILFTHWEITGVGVDAGQLLLLDKDFNMSTKKQLNYRGDTEIYSLFKYNNKYLICGDKITDSFISDFDIQLNEINNLSYIIPSSNYSYIGDINIVNNNLLAFYTTNKGNFGVVNLQDNLTVNKFNSFRDNTRSKFPRRITKNNNNILLLADNSTIDFQNYLNSSLVIFDNNMNFISELFIIINNSITNLKQMKLIDNKLFLVGYYLESNLRKSIIAVLDSNQNLVVSLNIDDYEIINDIIYVNNEYYIVGSKGNSNDYNGAIYYSEFNSISNLCNAINILPKTKLTNSGIPITPIVENYNVNKLTNIGYQDPSYTYSTSKTNEICKTTSNNLDFQLLEVDYKSPCSTDSVEIEIVLSSSNINVIWFDGSPLKKRYFTKNGNYKVTLTIPGVKDTTFDVSINSIYKGSATSNLTFSPDTLLFSNSDIDKLTCQTFTLTNRGTDTVTLNELIYLKKFNFSSPNSIFPITLFPKESKDLEVCFYGDKFKRSYTDSIRFDNCNNPKFLTLLADIPDDSLSFATRCMLKFNAAAPSKSIVMSKSQLNEYLLQFSNEYKLSNLLGLELFDANVIMPNQLVYLESRNKNFRILVVE